MQEESGGAAEWWTSPELWNEVESAAVSRESRHDSAPLDCNRLVWLLSWFNICLIVPLSFSFGWRYEHPRRVRRSWAITVCLRNRWKRLPTPANKIGHLIESHATSASPSPSLPGTTSSSFVCSTSDAPLWLALDENNPCLPVGRMTASSPSLSAKWEPRSLCVLWEARIFPGTKLMPHIFKVHGADLNFSPHSG